MASKSLISIQQICVHYNVPESFINALNDLDLIDIIYLENAPCISETHINEVEKMMRLHYDLDINLEGIDAIYNLLKQIEGLKQENTLLQNKLRFHKGL
jgi:hypothetical protein